MNGGGGSHTTLHSSHSQEFFQGDFFQGEVPATRLAPWQTELAAGITHGWRGWGTWISGPPTTTRVSPCSPRSEDPTHSSGVMSSAYLMLYERSDESGARASGRGAEPEGSS